MNHFFKKNRGFTLIEILVTISIVSFLLIISIPAFRNYRHKNDLLRGADLIQSAIYETKNLALAPQTEKNNDTKYYVINFETTTNTMSIYEANSVSTLFSDGILVKKFDLPGNIVFEDDDVSEIFFSIEDQGKIVDTNEEDMVIKIKNEKINDKNNIKMIIINKITGQVSIK